MYSEIKGHAYLLKSFSIILKKHDNASLILVGDGKLLSKIKNMSSAFNIGNYVYFAGRRSHNEIPLYMNAADLFVLPSLSEGNPTVMFEALGVGLPFVGTRVGGVPEIITSDEYGLLAEPGNPDDLAEKILVALEKEWDREKIRDYARQFTWENIAKQVMKVYEEVLSKSPSGE
ncbi:MAG: glycosyltransferase family 4 protein [Candidatus Methanosuratincola subterraneus]|uniref:Glycosyltransferase family 4 protein n=1 Tax=Methanosuratincola subterraneus TaxID=2593994 RepID=A0A444L7C9_METS7|nr:MAG: glycosyltransferase family 4 protein [Candidatus Methanosuratincola subterraneus]